MYYVHMFAYMCICMHMYAYMPVRICVYMYTVQPQSAGSSPTSQAWRASAASQTGGRRGWGWGQMTNGTQNMAQ